MKYLPWQVCPNDPKTIIDSGGCKVLNMSLFGVVGCGHSPEELVEFIVERANREYVSEEELKCYKKLKFSSEQDGATEAKES